MNIIKNVWYKFDDWYYRLRVNDNSKWMVFNICAAFVFVGAVSAFGLYIVCQVFELSIF